VAWSNSFPVSIECTPENHKTRRLASRIDPGQEKLRENLKRLVISRHEDMSTIFILTQSEGRVTFAVSGAVTLFRYLSFARKVGQVPACLFIEISSVA
jgi:hypothetical protein